MLGPLSLIVGIAFLYNLAAGSVTLVWMIGAWLLIGGIFEFATAFTIPFGKGWLVLVGRVDLALGAFVLMMEPRAAFALLGYYVGISLIFRALWTVFFVGEAHEIGHTVQEAIA